MALSPIIAPHPNGEKNFSPPPFIAGAIGCAALWLIPETREIYLFPVFLDPGIVLTIIFLLFYPFRLIFRLFK